MALSLFDKIQIFFYEKRTIDQILQYGGKFTTSLDDDLYFVFENNTVYYSLTKMYLDIISVDETTRTITATCKPRTRNDCIVNYKIVFD